MAIPYYDKIIIHYQSEINTILHEFVFKGYNAFSSYIKKPLGLCIILYFIVLGFGVMRSVVRSNIISLAFAFLKVGIVYSLAVNWGNFSYFVVGLFQKVAGNIGAVLLSSAPIALPHFAGEGLTGALQSILIEIATVGTYLVRHGSIYHIGSIISGMFVWLSGIAIVAFAFLEITMANILLSVLFVAGPLFLTFTLFAATRHFFDRWLGALAGCAFVLIFINIVAELNLSVLQEIVGYYYANHIDKFHLISFVPFAIVAVLSVAMLKRVTMVAMQLGGSFMSLSLASSVGGMLTGFFGASTILIPELASKKEKNGIATKQQSRKDKQVTAMQLHNLHGGEHEL